MGADTYIDWRNKGLCKRLSATQADKLFFPESGRVSNNSKAFCAGCPVMETCLETALEGNLDGVWAGTTKNDRDGILAFRRQLSTAVLFVPKIIKKKNIVFS